MEGTVNRIVLDANIGLALVISLPFSKTVERAWKSWLETQAAIYVPTLWDYETTSGLRRSIYLKLISEESAFTGLDYLDRLIIHRIPPSTRLNKQALIWAKRLNQGKAYDSVYVAAAKSVKAKLYTADERLVNACRSIGANWVHWIGEFS